MTAGGDEGRGSGLAVGAIALLLLARVVLAVRLAPGRDEAAYAWWAWNGLDASYSLATALVVRAATALLGDGAWAMRVPGLLAGAAAAVLAARLAGRLGASRRGAWTAALGLAAAPWQGYVGTVVHPDALLTLAVLGVAGALVGPPALLAAAAWAALGAYSKLTGAVLLLPVAAWALRAWRRDDAGGRRRATGALALVAAAAIGLAVSIDPTVLAGVRELGRFPPGLPALARLAAVAIEIALLAGPALLVAAAAGATRPGPARGVAWSVGGPILALFGGFLVLGQAKGNWFLPGLAVFVPWGVVAAERAGRDGGLRRLALATATLSLAGGIVWVAPTVPGLWSALRGASVTRAVDGSYSWHAGPRERAVSPARTWTDRLAEYGPEPTLDPRVRRAFAEGATVVASSDYGLAFRTARRLGRHVPVRLPGDAIFARRCAGPLAPGTEAVWVAPADGSGPPPDWARRFRSVEEMTPAAPEASAAGAGRNAIRVFRCRHWIDPEARASDGG